MMTRNHKRWLAPTSAVLALILAAPTFAGDMTASGNFEAGDKKGRWTAELTLDGEVVSGSIAFKEGPVRTARLSGIVRDGRIEFGVLQDDDSETPEVAVFSGTAGGVFGSASVAHDSISGTVAFSDGTRGIWEGTWRTQRAPKAWLPVRKSEVRAIPPGRDNALVPEFDAEVSPVGQCELVSSGAALSLGAGMAASANCALESEPSAAGSAATSGGAMACTVGAPVSNPPTPPTVQGTLLNNVSRSLQVWPAITQSETSVAVNMASISQRSIGYNNLTTLRGPAGVLSGVGFARYSSNFVGENPNQLAVPPLGSTLAGADPVVVGTRTSGRFWLANIALEFGCGPVCAFDPEIAISTSTDQGATYAPVQILLQSTSIDDKEWFAIDNTTGTSQGTQYACWTQFGVTMSRIMFGRRPAGFTGDLQDVSNISGSYTFPGYVHGCQVAVAPDSSVWVFWLVNLQLGGPEAGEFSGLFGRRSLDGITFEPEEHLVDAFTAPWNPTASTNCNRSALKGHIRIAPFPSLAIDQGDGTIYLVYSRHPPSGASDSEVVLTRSTDEGDSFAVPVIVNTPNSAGDKFMPAVAVSPLDGKVQVLYYDRVSDPSNLDMDVYVASSSDGGATFARTKQTAAAFGVPRLLPNFDCIQGEPLNAANCYMGDYNSSAALPQSSSFFFHVWGDNSLKFSDPDTGLNVPDPDIRLGLGC